MRVMKDSKGYMLWLSSNDTYHWAIKRPIKWPGSQLAGKKLFVGVDSNGLYDISVEGISSNELEAIVTDFIPTDCRHLWPTWE